MYVPLQVGFFFLLLFFLKIAFACIDGMCSNFILQVFSQFLFQLEKKSSAWGWGKRGKIFIRVSVAASRVPLREDVLQRYYENSASLLEILRNKIFGLAISGHLPFKYYIREGFARKISKITEKHFKVERVIP